MVPAHVIHLRLLHQLPDLRALQVRELVVVGGSQMRAHGPVLARDDDAAAAGGGVGGRELVFDAQAGLFAGGAQVRGVLVGADATNVEYGGGG